MPRRPSTARKPMRERFVSKPGKHGTLYLFRAEYTDRYDPAFGKDAVRLWAYHAEHAADRFVESADAEGWKLLSVEKVRA